MCSPAIIKKIKRTKTKLTTKILAVFNFVAREIFALAILKKSVVHYCFRQGDPDLLSLGGIAVPSF